MTYEHFQERLNVYVKNMEVVLTSEQQRRLYVHFQLLLKWSVTHNLVSRTVSDEKLIELHYADSLLGVGLLNTSQKLFIDIGSGAGFPGWVLGACSDVVMHLLEPRAKRVSFLRLATAQAGMSNVCVHEGRIENISAFLPELECPTIVQRATFQPQHWWQQLERWPHMTSMIWTTTKDLGSHIAYAQQHQFNCTDRIVAPWNVDRVVAVFHRH